MSSDMQDQDTLLAELEKENKILEEELEMIMKQSMQNRHLTKSKRSNPSERKKNLQRIDEEEMYAYSNSEVDNNENDSYEDEDIRNSLYNHHINQQNRKYINQQAHHEEAQRKQPQPIPQDSMKLINSLFEHQETKDSQIHSPNTNGSALLYSPISSLKKTKSVPRGLNFNQEHISQSMQRAITPKNGRVSFTERNNSKDRGDSISQDKNFAQISPIESNLNDKFKNFDNCENIMGISNRPGGSAGYDLQEESQRTLQQSTNKTSGRQSPKKDKIQSLEMRLSGTLKAVKELEKQIRSKDIQIKELNLEMLKKNKEIEKLTQNSSNQSNVNTQSSKNFQVQSSISDYVKKEKIFEKKIKDQENQINDLKKSHSRVQEVNSSLLLKIKDLEKDIEILRQSKGGVIVTEISSQGQGNNHGGNENLELRKKIKYLEKCLEEKEIDYDYLQKQHDMLIELSTEHLLKSENLQDAYSNIQQIVQIRR